MAMSQTETIYYVRNLDAAVEFYVQKLGWRLIERADWGWAQFDVDGTARVGLLLESTAPQEEGLPRPRIGLQTDDLEAEIEKLKASGVRVADPAGKPGETRATTFWDLDGNAYFLWSNG